MRACRFFASQKCNVGCVNLSRLSPSIRSHPLVTRGFEVACTTKFKGVAMKKLIALVCCVSAAPAWAADVGLGVSAESNDSTIYVPIDFGNTWRLEPFFSWSKSDSEIYDSNVESRVLKV